MKFKSRKQQQAVMINLKDTVKDVGYPTTDLDYEQSHNFANKIEKQVFGNDKFNELERIIDKKIPEGELAGTHEKDGHIEISKKIPEKFRDEVLVHELIEKERMNNLKVFEGESKIRIGASIIARMSEEERDNLDPSDAVGGWAAYKLYEARKLLPKSSDKLKRVNDNNSFTLYQEYNQIANIDGIYYGISHYEDPDNIEGQDESRDKYVFAYHRLDGINLPMIETSISINDVSELISEIKKHKGCF